MLNTGHFEDLLEHLERDVLHIDRTGDVSLVHILFRNVHNLKSSAAQAGLATVASHVHALEDVMDQVRRGRMPWTTGCYDHVTQVIDLVRLAIRSGTLEPGMEPGGGFISPESQRERAEGSLPHPQEPWGMTLAPQEVAACHLAASIGLGVYRVEKLFRQGLTEETFLSLPIMDDIRELGRLIAISPSWESYSQGPEEQVVKFLFASPRHAEELSEVMFDPLIVLRAPTKTSKERLRFLVIEDDPITGTLMQHILGQHGDAVHCTTGREALAAFCAGLDEGDPFDLATLDLALPDLSGDSVLQEIREEEFRRGIHGQTDRCQVIINTAKDDLDQMIGSLRHDPDGYLIKPINMDLVVEKINTLKAERIGSGERHPCR